jgi:hypothetical protein
MGTWTPDRAGYRKYSGKRRGSPIDKSSLKMSYTFDIQLIIWVDLQGSHSGFGHKIMAFGLQMPFPFIYFVERL